VESEFASNAPGRAGIRRRLVACLLVTRPLDRSRRARGFPLDHQRLGGQLCVAERPSAIGQGDSQAGANMLSRMFSAGPYGIPLMHPTGRPNIPRLNFSLVRPPSMRYAPYAKAGATAPEVVRDVGHGSLEKGSSVLDLFVGKVRDAAQH